MMYLYVIAIVSLTNVYGEAPANETIANYDPAELLSQIFNSSNTQPRVYQANKRFVPFEYNMNPDLVYFNEYYQPFANNNAFQGPVKYTDNVNNNNDDSDKSQIMFQDVKESKRRRKRKPIQHYGLAYPYEQNYASGANSLYGGQYYRPIPPPPSSLASEAVSRITEALTSIALYDDYQCVPRLLCEAAGGGALGSSGILQTVSGLEPLLTLLSAYNGLSTNPLFVFGRAVFLGMSSKGNTASCRYGYPLCPTDPEQLVYYLNNHNGGFFRFFNAQQQGPQNVEQFYNQLSQNYGPYPPQQHNQHYGFYNPNPENQNYDHPNIYSNYGQNYGVAYPHNDNRIQKRIQNKPLTQYTDFEEVNAKWTFPNDNYIKYNTFNDIYNDDSGSGSGSGDSFVKKGKALKFPEYNENSDDYNRKTKGFSFPESQSNRQYYNNYVKPDNHNNHYNNFDYANNEENDVRTVYVVRGNGDPNKPEIIKLRPGEILY